MCNSTSVFVPRDKEILSSYIVAVESALGKVGELNNYHEPQCEKTSLHGFRPQPVQPAGNFRFNEKRDCTIHETKSKSLISFAVTVSWFFT